MASLLLLFHCIPPNNYFLVKFYSSFAWISTTHFSDAIIGDILPPLFLRPYFFHFSLHSLSMGPIHYRISWETTGPLSRDSTGDHPKEVIGDILMSSKASVNLWHPVLMIHLGLYFMSSSYNSLKRLIKAKALERFLGWI